MTWLVCCKKERKENETSINSTFYKTIKRKSIIIVIYTNRMNSQRRWHKFSAVFPFRFLKHSFYTATAIHITHIKSEFMKSLVVYTHAFFQLLKINNNFSNTIVPTNLPFEKENLNYNNKKMFSSNKKWKTSKTYKYLILYEIHILIIVIY